MNITSVALGGLEAAQGALENTAKRLASIGATTPDGAPVDDVDLSAETIALLTARNSFETSVQVVHIADEMQKTLLNLLA